MATEGGGGSWTRTTKPSSAPSTGARTNPNPLARSDTPRSPRPASPQRTSVAPGQVAPTQPSNDGTRPGSRVSVSPMRALSPLRDRQFRASAQVEKKELPQPLPTTVSQTVDTHAGREWLSNSAFGERASVAPVVQRLLLKFAERKWTDDSIWEGAPEVIALLLSHKVELMATPSPEGIYICAAEQPIITVHFAIPGVKGANYKAYRVNRAQPTLQTVAQVCKRLNLSNPEYYALATMRNVLLDPSETLSAYGLGSLFESWELRLVERPPDQRSGAHPPTDMLRQASITVSFSSTVPEFSTVRHKHHKIKVDPYVPLWKLMAAMITRNKLTEPDKYCFVTTYEKSDNFILPQKECLASLGLGKYFQTTIIKILLRDKPIRLTPLTVLWTQLEESRITVPMARKVILDLDNEVATLGAELSVATARLREANAQSAARMRQDTANSNTSREESERAQSEVERLKEEYDRLKDEYDRLFEEDDTLKFEHQNLLGEQALLQSQLRKHAALTADAQAEAENTAKDAALLREQNASLQTENQQLYLLNGKLQHQIVAQERLNAEYLERLSVGEQSQGVSHADMEFEMNKLHMRYEEEKDKAAADAAEERAKLLHAREELAREVRALQLERERLAADAAASQTQAANARATAAELQKELAALKRSHGEEVDALRQVMHTLGVAGQVVAGGVPQSVELQQAVELREKEARQRTEEAEAKVAEARVEMAKAEDERLRYERLQRETADQAELHKVEKIELQRRIAEVLASNEEVSKKLADARAELQGTQEHVHTLEGQLAVAQRKPAAEAAESAVNAENEKRLKEETARADQLQEKLAHTRTKYTERIEALQNQHRKLTEEKMTLQGTITSLEQKVKDLAAMVPQKEGPGYQEDENIDKILLTKLDLKQLVTLINTLARQTNINLRTFLLHNKGASAPKPKQVERKPRAPAAPKAPPKNIVLAKTVDTSGPLSSNDLEAARVRLKNAQKDEERQPTPDDLAGIFAKQLANRFKATKTDVEDLDDSPADFDDDW